MKKLTLLACFLSALACLAQNLPLSVSPLNAPAGAYIHDYNNELDPYVGSWSSTNSGHTTTLFIGKKIKKLFNEEPARPYYSDVLWVEYTVKDAAGAVLQKTVGNVSGINHLYSISSDAAKNEVSLLYNGTNCSVGLGLITLKRINNNQLSWAYMPIDIILTPATCPGNPDTNIYLPLEKGVVFTRQ